jgi:hypothetical protein
MKPPPQPTPVTREALYAAIWEESMQRVAARYGVSPTYLAGVCDVLQIPRPPKGYWINARYNHSYNVMPRAPLPALDHVPLHWVPPQVGWVPAPTHHPARPLNWLADGASAEPSPAAVKR